MARRNTQIENIEADMLSKAVAYNCFLRISPTKKISEEYATLTEAVAAADRIRSENKGRDVLIYAIMPAGEPIRSVPVPKAMQVAARTPDFSEITAQAEAGAAKREAETQSDDAEIPAFLKRNRAISFGETAEQTPYPVPASAKPKAEKTASRAKPQKPEEDKASKQPGKRSAALEAAQNGVLPAAPDFSANTHKPFRKKLAALIALVEASDIEGLRAFPINPISSSPKALAKYRDLAVTALEARAAAAKAAA